MLKFTIRDWMILTVCVGIAICWRLDHNRLFRERDKAISGQAEAAAYSKEVVDYLVRLDDAVRKEGYDTSQKTGSTTIELVDLRNGGYRPAFLPAPKSYRASAEREAAILRSNVDVKPEMQIADVQRLMGSPDRVLPLYEPQAKNRKRLGSTSWYVIEEHNDVHQDFQGVRVSFDLRGRVTSVDRLGIDH